jgi:hypothetical protein
MKTGRRVFLALGLLGLGWAVGYAQSPEPDFMIEISGPTGDIRVQCISGCELMGVHDLDNPEAGPLKTYEYGCDGVGVQRCTGRAAGWLLK